MPAKHVLIVSPASARENNGNWHTASRWAHFLRSRYQVAIAPDCCAGPNAPDVLIALHARRSAGAVAAFARARPGRPCIVVLTGTDLYRDLASSPEAQASLEHATHLVLLQPDGVALLPERVRARVRVIYQSAPAMRPVTHGQARRHFDICMIGHLRSEKDPYTFMRAATLVTAPRVRLLHIGGALESPLGQAATATAATTTGYQWLGHLPHSFARQRLARSHAMAICSLMEGGANVIIEAVTCGVPVLASDISGNRGMLGHDYAGYFPVGDAAALARLIDRSVADPAWYGQLQAQCVRRAPLFAPERERAALLALLDEATAAGDAAGALAS
ncbi:TIGR04348 family glycosyltransferase [Massilia sp. PAMC28688]|uniref:selenoneine biosynthesis selenosugar synthase SenB n=1 Tax=Massilia sp. PAMC28688 TaxID=2861283 RepID=UPI001C62D2FA|nr:selenoneine biosynthesis selenosugar synthase SenB [Massilia sp. PAMC28688]QYF93626.1 TIGR04348 family glycosyltransferase [Massilia sp. PAMC28688]